MADLTGVIIGGRYHIFEILGEGGMATVYRARDNRLDREVAIKLIRFLDEGDIYTQEMLKRFEREARSLAKLSHPFIVKVHDYGEFEGLPYLVMEFQPGGTLRNKTGYPMPIQEAIHYLLPIASALDYAHQQNIIHRDIKPTNILLTATGEPMLSDFGIAKVVLPGERASATLTGPGVSVGTPEYTAPEQSTGKGTDPRSDIYSLGVVFYELITGIKPYVGDTPVAVMVKHVLDPLPNPKMYVPDIPEQVEQAIFKSLAKNPEERYQSMKEFAGVLEALRHLGQEPQSALPKYPEDMIGKTKMKTTTTPIPSIPLSPQPVIIPSAPAISPVPTPSEPMHPKTQSPSVLVAPIPVENEETQDLTAEAPPGVTSESTVDAILPVDAGETMEAKDFLDKDKTVDIVPQPVPVVVSETVETGKPVSEKPQESPPSKASQDSLKKRPVWIWIIAVVVILCLLAGAGGWWFKNFITIKSPPTNVVTLLTLTPTQQPQIAQVTEQPSPIFSPLPPLPTEAASATLEPENLAESKAIFGPSNGNLVHNPEGPVQMANTGVNSQNFLVESVFYTPFTISVGNWDIGYFFRSKADDDGMWLIIHSDTSWELIDQSKDKKTSIAGGKVGKFLDNTSGKPNKLTLMALEQDGFLFVNGTFIAKLDLSTRMDGGNISAETGYAANSQKKDRFTKYEGFTVWSIGSAVKESDGELKYTGSLVSQYAADVKADNFIVQATFVNPYASMIGPWDFGLIFRSAGENDQYRLSIDTKPSWVLGDKNPNLSQVNELKGDKTLLDGKINTGDGQQNKMMLIVRDTKGFLYLNGNFVKILDLSRRKDSGQIGIGIGFHENSVKDNTSIAFKDFTVWQIPQINSEKNIGKNATETSIAKLTSEPSTPTPAPENANLIAPTKIFGPDAGNLDHNPSKGDALLKSSGVSVRDFVAEATFTNPFAAAEKETWDIGFSFRVAETGDGYRLIIHENRTWELINKQKGSAKVIDSDKNPTHVKMRLDDTNAAVNRIRIIVLDNKGLLFVNGGFVSDMNLSALTEAGDVVVMSGYGEKSQKEGSSTKIEDFTIWKIGQPGMGPMAGQLAHGDGDKPVYRSAGVTVKNFIAKATFTNPYESNSGKWDIGFICHSTESSQLELAVQAGLFGTQWKSGIREASQPVPNWKPVGSLPPKALNVGFPASNEVLLFVNEDKGYFFINGQYAAPFDVSLSDAGDVAAATGFEKDGVKNGSITNYQNFTIWELP